MTSSSSLSAPAGVLRLGRRGSPVLERLQIRDPDFAHLVDLRAASVDRTGTRQRRQRLNVIGWSVIATVALVLTAWFGVPAIAERLALQLPPSIDRKLGEAVDVQVRATLDTAPCRTGLRMRSCRERTGRPRRARQTDAAAGGRRRAAGADQRDGRAPQGGQRHGAAGRADLRVPGIDRQGRQRRRIGGRDRARDRPCRASRRHQGGAACGRAVVLVRHAARRFRRRRRGCGGRALGAAVVLFARGGSGGRPLRRAT